MNKLSLHHLVQYPSTHNAGVKHPAVLALHGRGSNEDDLIGLAPYLPKELLWISPRGPLELGPGAYEWFQISQVGKPDPTRLANALHTVDQFINEILEAYPINTTKLFLLGFSQGSIVSLSYTLTNPLRVTGTISQSGYLPHESGLPLDKADLKHKPILLTHGIQDAVLPVDWARSSRDTLQRLDASVEYHEFNMGHTISAESLATINTWLEKQLS